MTLVPYLVVVACSFHSSVLQVETGLSLALLWDVALSVFLPRHPYPSLFLSPLPSQILWTVTFFLFELPSFYPGFLSQSYEWSALWLHWYMITGLFFRQMIALLSYHACFPFAWCSFPMESIHRFGMGMTLVPYLVVMACSFHSSVHRVETSLSLALLWDVALSALPPCHPYPSLFFPPLPSHILWTVTFFVFELPIFLSWFLFTVLSVICPLTASA